MMSRSDSANRTFLRRRSTRTPIAKVLIVTEGEKTEVTYFQECAKDLNISRYVKVTHNSDGPTPDKVLEYALVLRKNESRRGSPYDEVYCVMDQDRHSTFVCTLKEIKQLQKKGERIQAIASYPSFEYWLLLHYEYTRRTFEKEGNRSAGDCVVTSLKRYWSDYEKCCKNIYGHLKDKLPTALKHAQRARKDATATQELNPSTDVDCVVGRLLDLAGVSVDVQ